MYLHEPGELYCKKATSGSPENLYSKFAFDVPSRKEETTVDVFRPNAVLHPDECYIKIKITGKDRAVMFAAESYKESDTSDTGRTALHLRTSVKVPNSNFTVVCLRFNCPIEDKYTYIKIAPLTGECELDLKEFQKTRLFTMQYGQSNNERFSTDGAKAKEPPKTENAKAVKWLWIPELDTGYHPIYGIYQGNGGGTGPVETNCYNDKRSSNTITVAGNVLEYNCR